MGKDSTGYETFDSGSGPTIPEKAMGDFDHNDSGSKLGDVTDLEKADGGVPEVPMQKR